MVIDSECLPIKYIIDYTSGIYIFWLVILLCKSKHNRITNRSLITNNYVIECMFVAF